LEHLSGNVRSQHSLVFRHQLHCRCFLPCWSVSLHFSSVFFVSCTQDSYFCGLTGCGIVLSLCRKFFMFIFTLLVVQGIDVVISMSVCLSVNIYLKNHMSELCILPVIEWYGNRLYMSGFVNDNKFHIMGPVAALCYCNSLAYLALT